jgi:hypothetical protein
MKVSIIIPGYRTEYLSDLFHSINRQSQKPHEVLYEHTLEINAAEKINNLAKIATGDAILVISDDDRISLDYIEKTSKAMDHGWDIVYTDMLKFGKTIGAFVQPASDYTEKNFKASTVPWMTSLIRKTTFDEAGGWDPEQMYQDYDFYYRCFKNGATGHHIKEPLFEYRIHETAGSFNMDHDRARRLMKKKHPEIL